MVVEISTDAASDEFQMLLAQGKPAWGRSRLRIARAIEAKARHARRSEPVDVSAETRDDDGPRSRTVVETHSSFDAQVAEFKDALIELAPTPPGQEFYIDLIKIYPPKEARERAIKMMLNRDLPKAFAALEAEIKRLSDLGLEPDPEKYSNGRRKDGIEVRLHKHRGRLPKDEIARAHLAIDSFEEIKRSGLEEARNSAYRSKNIANRTRMLAEVQREEENLTAELKRRRLPLAAQEFERLIAKKYAQTFDAAAAKTSVASPKDANKHARRKKRSQRSKL
jgi:hypothetical protein